MRLGRIRSASLTRSRSTISPVCSRPACRVCMATQSGWLNRNSKTSSTLTIRSPPGTEAARQLSIVVLPACVPPATRMLSPARTDDSRKRAACGVRLPSATRSDSRWARSRNLRMLTAVKPRVMPSSTTCSRWPSGSMASTKGVLMSRRRPLDFSIRSTSSLTWAASRRRLVSSWRPRRAMNTRLGSLIHTSSTSGSSRNGCSGPKPDTRATSSPTMTSSSAIGATAPVRLSWSWSRTTSSAMRRTTSASRCGSTPSRRTRSRTCPSSCARGRGGRPGGQRRASDRLPDGRLPWS